jgi:hypothetical protein
VRRHGLSLPRLDDSGDLMADYLSQQLGTLAQDGANAIVRRWRREMLVDKERFGGRPPLQEPTRAIVAVLYSYIPAKPNEYS